MANDEIVRLIVDADGAIRGYRAAADAQERFSDGAERASRGVSKTQANIITLNQALDLGARVFRGLQSVATATFDALDQAQKVEGLSKSFENLQASVGANAHSTLPALKQATSGLVSELELMQAANQAVLLGVDDGSGRFEEMAAAAVKLGQATGRTATEALNDLTTAVGRGSKLIADNLGLVFESDAAYKKYAETQGIVGRELTENEKKLAIQNEIVSQATEKAAELAGVQETAAVAAQRLQTTFSDLTSEFYENFSQSDSLRDAINKLDKALKDIDFAEVARYAGDLAAAVFRIAAAMGEVASYAGKAKTGWSNLFNAIKQGASGDGLLSGRAFVEQFAAAFNDGTIQNVSEVFSSALNDGIGGALGALLDKLNPTEKAIKTVTGEITEASKEVERVTEQIKELDRAIQLEPQFNRLQQELEDLVWQLKDGEITTDQFNIALRENQVEFIKMGESASQAQSHLDDVIDRIEDVEQAAREAAEKARSGEIDFLSILFGQRDENGAISFNIEGAFDGLLNTLDSAFSGDKSDLKNSLEGLGAEIGSNFGILGKFIGPKLGKGIFNAIDHIFLSEHPDTTARKAVSEYFSELLADVDLTLVINDKLTEVTDLIFNDLPAGVGGKAYNIRDSLGLSDDEVAAFGAAGEAIRKALNFEDIPKGQLGAIFANNFESLNNLQLALEAMGITAEQTLEGLKQGYLGADISAKEFLASQAHVKDIFAQGIPGAVGATLEAFNNFINNGLASGRDAWDALGDIAAEAQERQIHSLPELFDLLVEQGASVEEVTKLWETLGKNGIKTIEDLKNVTVGQTAQIVSDLQDMGFGFQEWEDRVKGVKEAIEEIPTQLETNWKINISTNAQDSGARDLVDSGALRNVDGFGRLQ